MTKHLYDDPTLTPRQFLEAVMHDPSVEMHLRNRAADYILRIWGNEPPAYTVRISSIRGGPDGIGPRDTIGLYRDLVHIKRCYDLTMTTGKLVSPDLETTEPEGHA